MEIILTTNFRPYRLLITLLSLLFQKMPGNHRKILKIVDDTGGRVTKIKHIQKVLKLYKLLGWEVFIYTTNFHNIPKVKLFAMDLAEEDIFCIIDNDVFFPETDIILKMHFVLKEYEVGAVSPLAFDLDSERDVLNSEAFHYDLVEADENCVSEGNTALGLCIMMYKKEYKRVRKYLEELDLNYFEDQVLIHFIKKNSGYAFVKDRVIYHIVYKEEPNYVFNNKEVLKWLKKVMSENEEFRDLYNLRLKEKDGANFSKPIKKRRRYI